MKQQLFGKWREKLVGAESPTPMFDANAGKALNEERIAEIRAKYAAFAAINRAEGNIRSANLAPHASSSFLKCADAVIAACEAIKVQSEKRA